jgi:hypothetical protein
MPLAATAASSVEANPVQETAAVTPDRAREALAQLQTPGSTQMQAKMPKEQAAQHQRKIGSDIMRGQRFGSLAIRANRLVGLLLR